MSTDGVAAEIAAKLRRRITEDMTPGDRLPPVRDLMTQYKVTSFGTINQIIRDLTAEGLLTTRPRAGVYVRQPRRRYLLRDLGAARRLEWARAAEGVDDGQGLLEVFTGADDIRVDSCYDWIPAPERVADILGLPAGERVLERTFAVAVDGVPHQVTRSYLPTATADAAGLDSADRERPGIGTMAQLRAAGITVGRAHILLECRLPTPAEAGRLEILPGTSVFELAQALYAGERVVEWSVTVTPGDRVAYVFDVNLGEGS